MLILKKDIEKILDEYLIAKESYNSTENPIFRFIKTNFKRDLESSLGDYFSVDSYSSTKDLGTNPRVKIIDETIDKQNFYLNLMYYFKSDMSGLYLILKVPYERNTKKKYGKYYASYLRNKSKYIREFLEENVELKEDLDFGIDLGANRTKLRLHNSATIVAKYYEKNNIPSTEELVSDIKLLSALRKFILENYTDQTEISTDEWVSALENKSVIDDKMFNILEIMYEMEDYKATTDQLIKIREKLGFSDEKSYNSTIIANSHRVKKFLNKKAVYNKDGSENYWMRFFYGKDVRVTKNGKRGKAFQFKLKDELVDALGKVNRKVGLVNVFQDVNEIDFDGEIIETEMVDDMEEEKLFNSFYEYLLDQGYLFDKETIENYLLSLKVKPFAILTGNSGTGKTKLSQIFAKYLSDVDEFTNIDNDYVTVKAKANYSSWSNTGWTLNKEDFKNIIPISECEGSFDITVDSIPGEGTINLLVQLYYDKDSHDLINYFQRLYEEEKDQIVDLKINTEAIKQFSSDSYVETNGSIILKQNSNKSAFEDRQWFMSKEFFDYVPFSNGYTRCDIIVGDYKSSARIRITPKLTFKRNERIQEYLRENEGKVVDVEIKVEKFNFENFKPIWSHDLKGPNEVNNIYENYKIIPVGANWTENRHIVGYYNVITNEYQSTPAYDLIKRAQESNEPHFLILDEMNLSHVERYFADFLSAIESGESIPLYGEEELEIPSNLFIIGTVNVDETTYMFSPKVLDRANVLEFETYPSMDYMLGKFDKNPPNGNIKYLENPLTGSKIREYGIDELHELFSDVTVENKLLWDILSDEITQFQSILKESGFDFGFRVINEIVRFMAVAWEYEGKPSQFNNWTRYFDVCIKQKILPKLHGSEKIIGETLDELYKNCLDSTIESEDMAKYPQSYKKLKEMRKVLRKQRYVSFIN